VPTSTGGAQSTGAPLGLLLADQQQAAQNIVAQNSILRHQLKWISSESAGKCIDLHAIVPDEIPITSTGKVSAGKRAKEARSERSERLEKRQRQRLPFLQ